MLTHCTFILLKEKIDKEYVYITCDPGNIASQRIIEKLGCATKEKDLKKYIL